MDKQEALNEFLKGLRIALNNAAAYDKNHPYFRKSAEIFKEKTDTLLGFLNPIKIGFSPGSLYIDGQYLEKTQLYLDLASMFHLRKIKSLQIAQGFSVDELVGFLSSISLPIREILRQGGFSVILNKISSSHFSVEELDYSQLLQSDGEECKDVWIYLFKQSVKNQDPQQINEFAGKFDTIAPALKAGDLSEDEELRESLKSFLGYLKDRQKDKFYSCSKSLLKSILRQRGISEKESVEKIKDLFNNLRREDFADVLLDEISKDAGFDNISFQVFSRLAGEEAHKEIAATLGEKVKKMQSLENSARARKKMKELFSIPDPSFISILYQKALETIFKESELEGRYELDSGAMNFYFILLHLLSSETDRESLALILARIGKEFENITKSGNREYIKLLLDALWIKQKEDPSLAAIFEEIIKRAGAFIEKMIISGEEITDLKNFLDRMQKSSLGFDYYLQQIFELKQINRGILTSLFKFFPEGEAEIYRRLELMRPEIDFQVKFVKSLEGVDAHFALEALKKIFSFSNNVVKIEILKSMQSLKEIDEEFLLSAVDADNSFIKKEALKILSRDKGLLKKALDRILVIPGIFFGNSGVIMENIMIVEEIGLAESKDYLLVLSKRPFFWNRKIRERASEALKNLKC